MSRTRGKTGSFQEVDSQFGAARVSMRPPQLGNLGFYQASHESGLMAAGLAADAEIFSFRWADSTRLALISYLAITGLAVDDTGFTAGEIFLNCIMARSMTVSASGGTAATLTTNNAKLRTDMGTTLVSGSSGDFRGSSTAALTAATETLDACPIHTHVLEVNTTANQVLVAQDLVLFDWRQAMYHPIVCEQDEGLVIRATVPATGTWRWGLKMCWAEVTSANWPNGL